LQARLSGFDYETFNEGIWFMLYQIVLLFSDGWSPEISTRGYNCGCGYFK
jgi:hypothetical protein